ncbi:transglycosylase family protein [Mycobacterium intracellulare]|uniref:Transglycosylase family protein n=2 Tax=Mycobacterium intracellulare TaxID=1767 RepID=A0AAE4RD88_MYCIT|nr:transglycosylase family protein [Mycobacterium intracellulare]MDV6978190.1 transglycosylase family protein [Mycobacterium intracellulare]MDV7013696.1 transglycosylase family protein [Mycobacterium intracellulare]
MKQLMAEITGIEKQADKSGQKAGEAISKGVSKGATKAGQTIHDAIAAGAEKAGADAGKAAGDGLNKGISKGAKDAGKSVGDELTKATKRTGDSIVKDLGGSILEAARQGAKDAGTTLEAEMGKAAAKAGRAIGNAIGDSPLGGWVRSLGVDGDQVISVMDGIGKSITGVKNQDIGGTLTGVADALNGIGQSDAANVFEKLGTVAGNTQQSFRDIKGDIEDTATGLGLLATNSPKAAKGLESIGAAAGPIGLTVAAAKELDDALTELGVAKYAEVPGSALWFMHQLSNGFAGVKDFLGATPFGGPDPTKGFQSPIQPKPGVSVIPLPGSAPAVEDGYTAVTGSMDPFSALAPQGKPGAAPSGNVSGPGVPLVQTASGTWTSPNPAWAHLIARESSGINQRQKIIDVNSGGNEAEGLFQITPRTWAAHGGTNLAPSPLAATPQQQAQIAARILQSNPSGSDWGAGLPGRENPQALLQGILPTGFDDGGQLPPGLQLVNNASGKPEIVLTQDQAKNAMQGMPGVGAGPSDTPLSSGMSPGQNGAAALTSLLGQQPDGDPLAAVTNPGGAAQRTQGYIPAGAGGSGQAGTSLWSGAMQMGASAVNGLIEQAASAASTAISAAATAGSFGAGGQAGGAASQFLIGIGSKMAERGVQYGFQLAGIGGDALTEILMPFGVPRFFQTDPSQFMPQLPNMAAAVTTGEKAQQLQGNPQGAQQAGINPSGPVQPGQMPGQQPVGPSVPIATEGTGNFTPAPVGTPGLSPTASGPGAPSVAPAAPLGPEAPKSGPMAPQPDQPPVQPKKPPGALDFVPLDMPGVFDDGGWLQPNGIAVNLSNKPEPILNADQWGDMHAIAAQGMPELDPKAANGYAPNFSVTIDSVTVKDVNELQREIDSRQRLQMWRHAGRP